MVKNEIKNFAPGVIWTHLQIPDNRYYSIKNLFYSRKNIDFDLK